MAIQSTDLVGTWQLTDHTVFSSEASGLLLYHPNGSMAVVITGKLDKSGSPIDHLIAYAGTFTVEGEYVVHHVTVSDNISRLVEPQRRYATLNGTKLILSETSNLSVGAAATWERVQ
jgi:hypothetical protein